MMDSLMTPAVTTVQAAAVNVFAQGGFDPGVTVQSDAPFLPALRDVAGWGMALGLVFIVLIIVVGGVLISTGKITNTPGNQSKGFMVLLFGLVGAAVVASASGLVLFGTGIGLTGDGAGTIPGAASIGPGALSLFGAF